MCVRAVVQTLMPGHRCRRDELTEQWRIFTPALHAIDRGEVQLEEYAYGSRGPKSGGRGPEAKPREEERDIHTQLYSLVGGFVVPASTCPLSLRRGEIPR